MQVSITEVLSPIQIVKFGGRQFEINKNPSWKTIYLAENYKQKIIAKEKYNNWLSSREAILFLVKDGTINEDYEKSLKDIVKAIDNHKKLAYQLRNDDKSVAAHKKKIRGLLSLHGDIYSRVHSLDYITFEYYVNYMHDIFLLSKNISPVPSFAVLERIYQYVYSIGPSIEDIRIFARTEPWKSYWSANKPHPFKYEVVNQEQISLMLYSRMYDGIHEHPECPEDFVINDDDLLDGWLILNKEKAEREKLTSEMERKNPKLRNATEVFLPAKNAEQIENIGRLNSEVAKSKKVARETVIKTSGSVSDKEFAKKGLDVK